jgi:hypothetical protein
VGSESVDQYQEQGHKDLATQLFDAPDIPDGLKEFLHRGMILININMLVPFKVKTQKSKVKIF